MISEKCFFKGECEFRDNKTRACSFEGTCNQRAVSYLVDDKTVWLRTMNGNLVTLLTMPKHLRKQLIKGEQK